MREGGHGLTARPLLVTAVAIVMVVLGLVGCSDGGPGGATTCSEFLALELDPVTTEEELMDRVRNGSASKEQQDILKNLLEEQDLSTDGYNVDLAYGQIVLGYCGVDGSGNRMHPNQSIENGLNVG